MTRIILAHRPQIVHCFKPKAHSGLVHLLLWLMRFAGLWSGALVVDADDWEGRGGWIERSSYGLVVQRISIWQEQWGLRHADAVTVASKWLLERAAQIRSGEGCVRYLPNCVGPLSRGPIDRAGDALPTATNRSPVGSPTVILATRFVETSPPDICAIWRTVVRHCPAAQLLVVGQALIDEEDDLLQTEAERSGIADSILLTHWVSRERYHELLRSADIAILPSDESLVSKAKFPTRLLDAMAEGLPVVATDVGESARIVEHQVSGILAPAGDLERFANEVVRLLGDAELRAQLGERAKREAHGSFACTVLIGAVELLYSDLLSVLEQPAVTRR